jgi:hypothetical protein
MKTLVVKFRDEKNGLRAAYVRVPTESGGVCEYAVEQSPPVTDEALHKALAEMLIRRGVNVNLEVKS